MESELLLYQKLVQTISLLENGGVEVLDSKDLIDLLEELQKLFYVTCDSNTP